MVTPNDDERATAARVKSLAVLQPHRRPVWFPHVTAGDPGVVASKYFGVPWMAEGEAWPRLLGLPARFVLQLAVPTLPEPMRQLLGGDGLIQFFYQTDEVWPDDNDLSRLALVRRVRPDLTQGASRIQPAVGGDGPREPKAIVGWDVGTDLPRYEDYDALGVAEALEAIRKEFAIRSDLDGYQGDKLGGWPFWTQGNETPVDRRGEPMAYFYQIDAGCFFDGLRVPAHAPELFAASGTGHLFVSRSDPSELKFWWACT